jgi:hypothetical protein
MHRHYAALLILALSIVAAGAYAQTMSLGMGMGDLQRPGAKGAVVTPCASINMKYDFTVAGCTLLVWPG